MGPEPIFSGRRSSCSDVGYDVEAWLHRKLSMNVAPALSILCIWFSSAVSRVCHDALIMLWPAAVRTCCSE